MTFDELFQEHNLTAAEREALVWRLAGLRSQRAVETLLPRQTDADLAETIRRVSEMASDLTYEGNCEMDQQLADAGRLLSNVEGVLKRLQARGNLGPFICGRGGKDDKAGMPDVFYVCPAEGSDLLFPYRRVERMKTP